MVRKALPFGGLLFALVLLVIIMPERVSSSVAHLQTAPNPVTSRPGSDRTLASTIVFSDDFSADPNSSGLWTIHRYQDDPSNEVYWDPENEVLYLTRAANARGAAIIANYPLTADQWQASFRYKAGGGSGADGLVFMFYKDADAYGKPNPGGGLGFMVAAYPAIPVAGYGVEFDGWQNPGADWGDPSCGDPSSRHIAVVEDSTCIHLVSVDDDRVEDNTWHYVEIDFAGGLLEVSVDGGQVINHVLAVPDYSYAGIGFAAATGGSGTNNHIIDDFVLSMEPGIAHYDDEFTSPSLDPKWSWIREDPSHWSLTERSGYLRIVTQYGDLYQGYNDMRNLLLQPMPGSDFEMIAKVSIDVTQGFQQAGLLIYQDDDNYLKLVRSWDPLWGGADVIFGLERNGVFDHSYHEAVPASIGTLYYKISRSGGSFTGYYSQDGIEWASMGVYSSVSFVNAKFGLLAANGYATGAPEIPADFDFFHVTLPDIRFRPYPDGYSFSNIDPSRWGVYPDSPANSDFTKVDMRRMFGDVCVCADPACNDLLPQPNRFLEEANKCTLSGHCFGMASGSLRLFAGLDAHPIVPNTYDLDLEGSVHLYWESHEYQTTARRHISFLHVLQDTHPIMDDLAWIRQHNTPKDILALLRLVLSGSPENVPLLAVFPLDRTAGHALTPYAIQDRGDGIVWVMVYDPNHPYSSESPDDSNRHVQFDTQDDIWQYDLGGLSWAGNAASHTLSLAYPGQFGQPDCGPWAHYPENAVESPTGDLWLCGGGHLLATDSQGRRIGFVGDQFVNEVPGAFESPVFSGLSFDAEPIYTLPLTDTYILLLDGQTLTQTETVGVTQFGPGYAVWADPVILAPGSQDHLSVASDGTSLGYRAGQSKEATLALALDTASESYQLEVAGADIGAEQVLTLTADVASEQLVPHHGGFDKFPFSGKLW